MSWIRALILVCAWIGIVAAQGPPTLQLGTPIERTIAPGQTHVYTVTAEENMLVQITVEQRGIDVVVRIQPPGGKKTAEYDSPNGADGPENVSFVSTGKTPYRIEVTPLNREASGSGKYEIRLIELRQATEEEIKQGKSQEALKARGLALLAELEGVIAELRSPQTRIKAQMQAAGLLWEADEKRALKYVTDAITGFKELISNLDTGSKEYTRIYYPLSSLRYELVQMLKSRQPEMALNFLRSTPQLSDPYGHQRDQASQDAAMQLEIANQIAQKDPKRALEIAREILKTRYTSALTSTIATIRQQNPEMAAELANEVASKIMGEKLLNDSQAASIAVTLIQMSRPIGDQGGSETNGTPRRVALLSEQTRRDLIQKVTTEALSYKPPAPGLYSPERDAAWNMLQGLQQMGPDAEVSMSDRAAAVETRIREFSASINPQMEELQRFHTAINDQNMPLDEVLQTLARAPRDHKDQLYIQLANRVMNNGDMARARQIVNEYVTTPYQRQQALFNLETQETFRAMGKGKIEDALRSVASLSSPQERAQLLSQMANQIGPGQKRAAALLFLEQARALMPASTQAQDATQMQALFEFSKAFARYDSKRAFEILDPLVEQFNEISAAARIMEGFGGEFFDQEELNLQNGSAVANIATHLTGTLSTLALTNFDRARLTADRIRLPELRLRAYLDIAQSTILYSR